MGASVMRCNYAQFLFHCALTSLAARNFEENEEKVTKIKRAPLISVGLGQSRASGVDRGGAAGKKSHMQRIFWRVDVRRKRRMGGGGREAKKIASQDFLLDGFRRVY